MAVERKCSNCGTWNKDEDRCTFCNTPISPVLIEKIREEKREEIRRSAPPSKLDLFIEAWKNHRFLAFRVAFWILYSIGFIFFSIAGFFAWMAASPNG